MEELVAPDGTVKAFRPNLAAFYKAKGWKPAKKSAAKKTKAGNVGGDAPDTGTDKEN